MSYSGKFKPKNYKKYKGDPTRIFYRSLWERRFMVYCDNNENIIEWGSEEVIIPYLYEVDKRYHRYFMDLIVEYTDGKVVLIEIKPHKETKPPTGARKTKRYLSEAMAFVKNQNKWEAANEYAKDRGWQFTIWTEKELSKMGILPKSTKPLKPYSRKKK